MLQKLHKNAKTNYTIRKEIKQSNLPINTLARKYNLSWLTVKKWKERENVEDLSSRPHKLRTTLTKEQEEDLKEKLISYLNSYNFEVKLRQLNYQTPAQYLKQKYNFSIQVS